MIDPAARRRHARCAALLALALLAPGRVARAEEYFSRFDFHLDAEYATSSDPRFNWVFDFGGDLDVIAGSRGRAIFVANYEAIAGEQFRRFDVNQGNYLLQGAVLLRLWGVEAGPVWHHVSRHLSDRPKRFPIDWNMIALRVRADRRRGTLGVAWRGDARLTVTSAFVDYDWELDGELAVTRHLTPRTAVRVSGQGRVVGTDGSRARGRLGEGRVEAAVRFSGRGAHTEFFAGVEHRIDAYPLEFSAARWALVGVRLLSR